MITQNCSKEEIAAIRGKLSVEGWEENELLPQHQLNPSCLKTKVKTDFQMGRQGMDYDKTPGTPASKALHDVLENSDTTIEATVPHSSAPTEPESAPATAPAPTVNDSKESQKENIQSRKIRTEGQKVKPKPKSQPPLKLICTYCKKMFPSRPDFNLHIPQDHLKAAAAKKITCSLCKKGFLSKPEFQEHMEDAQLNKINIKPVDRTFNDPTELNNQQQTQKHKGRLPHNCDLCDKKFTNKKDLKKHTTSEHPKKKISVIPIVHTDSLRFKYSKRTLRFESEEKLNLTNQASPILVKNVENSFMEKGI